MADVMEEYALTVYSLLVMGNRVQGQRNLEELSRMGAAAGLISGNNEAYSKLVQSYRIEADNMADEFDNEGDPNAIETLKLML